MKVTANTLLNYIRCRRYASLNDPNSDYEYQDFEVNSKNYYHEYLKLFKQMYKDDFVVKDENRHLYYEFHNDLTLSENYHFLVKKNNKTEIYIMIPSTSRSFLKIKYKSGNHVYQMFKKDRNGHYSLNIKDSSDETSNFEEKLAKLTKRQDDLGRIVYKYAFKRYLYDVVYPDNNVKIYFVLLNSDYIHDGREYTKQLFNVFDFSGLYSHFDDVIDADLYRMINHIELNDFTPCKLVRKECNKSDNFECKFVDFCFSHLPKENSILNYFHSHIGFTEPNELGDIHHDTYDLINEGLVDMQDIPILWLKDEKHLMQRYCNEADYEYIHKEKISAILKTLKYPLVYLDFEALPCLLPRYRGEKPFTQSVFQYSIHIEHVEGELELDDKNHYEFIANPEYDNRKELVKLMIGLINRYDSSVIVYHKTYEEQRLKELQRIFPEFREELQKIIDRLFDLRDVVKNSKRIFKSLGFSDSETNRYNFYSSKLSGSYSLKKVIKVFNESAYENLKINNGIDAYKAYMNLDNLDSTDRDEVIDDLLAYCKQDTYSMFEIIDGLKKKISTEFSIT